MKRTAAFLLSFVFFVSNVYALPYTYDERIFTDPVRATYSGRTTASSVISNINFADLPGNPVFEPVARLGALNVIKGYDNNYRPNDNVSVVEMLGSVIRVMGLEGLANERARQLAPSLPPGSDLRRELKIGYLAVANQERFITPFQYGQAIADQTTLDPTAFLYDGPVTRQQAATWLYHGMTRINQDAFASVQTTQLQSMFNFSDWEAVLAENLQAVEIITAAGGLTGTNGRLRPNDYLTRAELANMYKALDEIIYGFMGVEKRSGTVGGIRSASGVTTGSGVTGTDVYVRADDGMVDVFKNYTVLSASRPPIISEVVVFRNDVVSGLAVLEEGDEIEYLYRPATNEVLYVQVRREAPAVTSFVSGKFRELDFEEGTITIENEAGEELSFIMQSGMNFSELDNTGAAVFYIMVDNKKLNVDDLPRGSTIILRLVNNIVDQISYVGEPNMVDEFRGIVIENNPDFGYLVVYDNSGRRIIKDFYESEIKVKKREYFQNDDLIGYIDEVFPNFKYNPVESTIDTIEPGDIVFIVNDPEDPNYIKSIYAVTNYVPRYGKILRLSYDEEEDFYEMQLEYENKQTSWYVVPAGIFVTRNGRPVAADTIQPGDWARVLVNQAIIGPGYIMESVKEIVLEGEAHNIMTILRGQLSGLNPTQNKLLVQNVLELTHDGWKNYKQAAQFDIGGRDTEYFHNDKQISLDAAMRYFKHADVEVYIALENNFSGDKVRKVTFRNGRDENLGADVVMNADGNGNFYTMQTDREIATDSGTIVRRHGRLVDGVNIMYNDYAVVVLNDGNTAAVVDILDYPSNDAVILHRGGVIDVEQRNNFQVRSFSQLMPNLRWQFSPEQRLYDINYKTTFVTEDGEFLSYNKFIDYISMYTDPVGVLPEPVNAADMVYYVLTNGTQAEWIIEARWSQRAVTGKVYAVDAENGQIFIKDAAYRDDFEQWRKPSTITTNTSPTYIINVPNNSLVLKNNEVVGIKGVEEGNVLTILLPDTLDAPWLVSEEELDGVIILVDR